MEGAGVKLRRAFGFGNTSEFDPFLLFDDFRNDRPDDYLAGFPWHPHRGIETITYVLAGTVEHGDSLGNRGTLGAGDVQWMTAGSGILHQEMPKGDAQGRMHGFQLWANLPSSLKMTGAALPGRPGRGRSPTSPTTTAPRVRVVCGEFWGKTRPGRRHRRRAALPRRLGPAGRAQDPAGRDDRHSAFAYVFAGSGTLPRRLRAARCADRARGRRPGGRCAASRPATAR